MNFFKKFTFCSFSSFGIHAKDTKFINETPHTHRNIDTHRHTETDTISFLHFTLFGLANFVFGIPQTYTCTDTQTCTHRHTHVQRH